MHGHILSHLQIFPSLPVSYPSLEIWFQLLGAPHWGSLAPLLVRRALRYFTAHMQDHCLYFAGLAASHTGQLAVNSFRLARGLLMACEISPSVRFPAEFDSPHVLLSQQTGPTPWNPALHFG